MKLGAILIAVLAVALAFANSSAEAAPKLPSKAVAKALVKKLSPAKAIISERRPSIPGTRLFVSEFDRSAYDPNRANPYTGLLAAVASEYAIVSFYGEGELLFSRGGAINSPDSWNWVDPAGNPITAYDERISRFDALAAPFQLSGKPLTSQQRNLLNSIALRGSKIVELPNQGSALNRRFLIEFNPQAYRRDQSRPQFGALVSINKKWAIAVYYKDGQPQYGTGGAVSDLSRISWSLVDPAGNQIDVNDPRIEPFSQYVADFVGNAGKQNYIVLYNNSPTTFRKAKYSDVTAYRAVKEELSGNDVTSTFSDLNGYAAQLTPEQAEAYRKDQSILLVEEDSPVYLAAGASRNARVTRSTKFWNLDRIDQRSANLDGKLMTRGQGQGVDIYVLDTGVNYRHQEFTGRVRSGFNALGSGSGERSLESTDDCNGHGTHVAGTAAGETVGVASQATIVPVRALDCDGNGYKSDVLQSIDWVIKNHQNNAPAVLNISLEFSQRFPSVDSALRKASADRVTVVAAAGNYYRNSCEISPGGVSEVITVGAVDSKDRVAYSRGDEDWGSNWGPCVDIFAPGRDIVSAGVNGSRSYQEMDGTSMASPHAAGAAAVFLARNRSAKPVRVSATMARISSQGTLSLLPGYPGNFLNTTNRLLYVGA